MAARPPQACRSLPASRRLRVDARRQRQVRDEVEPIARFHLNGTLIGRPLVRVTGCPAFTSSAGASQALLGRDHRAIGGMARDARRAVGRHLRATLSTAIGPPRQPGYPATVREIFAPRKRNVG